MRRSVPFLMACLCLACAVSSARAQAFRARGRHHQPEFRQETGFLNRTVTLHGANYRFQIYLPESYRGDERKPWPVILFLHGRGERGSEGLWQTQIGLPQAVRDHPERWPFIIVLPQCPLASFWTDPEMLTMAMAALDQESAEFHGDPERTYLTGLSMGGYGAWELARLHPQRWAAIAIAAGGVFWSYAPERWQEAATLPAHYAGAIGRTPLWLFHGADDTTVVPQQSELMYEALKKSGGHVRFWIYQGLKHDCWTRAYGEPELPRWLLAHRRETRPGAESTIAERQTIPLHPLAIRLGAATLDALCGEYRDANGRTVATLFRQGEILLERNQVGEVLELAPESASVLFYPNGSSLSRLNIERDAQGHVTAAVFHDDRHDERWERRLTSAAR